MNADQKQAACHHSAGFAYAQKFLNKSQLTIQTISCLLVGVLLLLSACKKDDDKKPQLPGIVTASAGEDQAVLTGQTVALDASASKDSQERLLSYNWTFTSKPQGSTTTLANATQVKATFTPDKAGTYEIELTTTSISGQSKDKVSITASEADVSQILGGEILTNRTLEDLVADPTKPDYRVTADIILKAALTIQPGVVIIFEKDKALYVEESGGALIAKGMANKKILFTGKETTKGFWKGILVSSSSLANELTYTEVSYAGGGQLTGMPAQLHAEVVVKSGKLKLTHATFSNSGGYGLYIDKNNTELTGFIQNTFTANTGPAMYLHAKQLHKLDKESTFTGGNGYNGVETGGLVNAVAQTTWPAFMDGSPYLVSEDITISSGVKITEGATLEFAQSQGLYVNEGGYLIAAGTASHKITFTGKNKTKGYWKGIRYESDDAKNELTFAEVSYGGESVIMPSGIKANVFLNGDENSGGRLKIANTTLSYSGGYGMYVEDGPARVEAFANNTFSHNMGAALHLYINQLHKLDAASKFNNNNGYNGVETWGALSLSQQVNWPVFEDGSKYLAIDFLVLHSGVKLQTSNTASAMFEFAADKGLYIFDEGYLIAKGNGTRKIIFTGEKAQKGFWQGLLISSSNKLNELEHVQITNAGSSIMVDSGQRAGLVIKKQEPEGSFLKITHSLIKDSAGYGIYIQKNATINADAQAANLFEANTSGDYLHEQ